MTVRGSLTCLGPSVLLACGGIPPPTPTPTLTYAASEPRTADYRMGDTATVSVDGGHGTAFGLSLRVTGLQGPVNGELLWNSREGILVWSRNEKELSGTMEIPAVGAPSMGLRLEGTTTVRLAGS